MPLFLPVMVGTGAFIYNKLLYDLLIVLYNTSIPRIQGQPVSLKSLMLIGAKIIMHFTENRIFLLILYQRSDIIYYERNTIAYHSQNIFFQRRPQNTAKNKTVIRGDDK